MDILMLFERVSSTIGYITVIFTFIFTISKQLRKIIVAWINKKVGIDQQNLIFAELHAKLDLLLNENNDLKSKVELYDKVHLYTLKSLIMNLYHEYKDKEFMSSDEKKVLIQIHHIYKNDFNGNGYMDFLYTELMNKPSRLGEKSETHS